MALKGLEILTPQALLTRRMTRNGPFIDSLVASPRILDLESTPKVANKAPPRWTELGLHSLVPRSPQKFSAVTPLKEPPLQDQPPLKLLKSSPLAFRAKAQPPPDIVQSSSSNTMTIE